MFVKRWIAVIVVVLGCFGMTACSDQRETVLIYTSAEDYRVEYMRGRLEEEFPQYRIVIEYMTSGEHAAKLLAEGTSTACDITYDLEYTHLQKLADANVLANLSSYDFSVFCDDTVVSNYYMPEYRNGGAVIVNPIVLEKYGLPIPTCYDDLLKTEYKGLIAMPNPASSGTGYMFLHGMVNARGEEAAFTYFDKLSENILQFTSSGAGPINLLIQQEVAIGLSITGTAVTAINDGANLDILFFEEGSPYALYGQGMIAGKDIRPAVKAVFDFLYGTYTRENCEMFFPEPIFKDKTFTIDNYPMGIVYSDMSNNTAAQRERLLSRWEY